MRKTSSILVSSFSALAVLLLILLVAVSGSVSARTQETETAVTGDAPSRSLSNFDARGNFHNLSGPTNGDPLTIALDFIQSHSQSLGVTDADVADLVVTDQYASKHTGVTHIYLQQQYEGILVNNGRLNINIATDGSVINVGNRLVANLAQSINRTSPDISAETAVEAAARQLGLSLSEPLVVEQEIGGVAQAVLFSDGGISQNAIPASLVYEFTDSGAVRLAWNVEIYELSSLHWWTVRIDAVTGDLISQTDYVNNENWGEESEEDNVVLNPDAYRVFAMPKESPYDGADTLEADPANATASPFAWHDTNGVAGAEFTITQGNNVHADTDLNANNSPDGNSPDGGASLIFDYPFDPAQQPADYIPFAVTNLFYWNNIMHDVMYLYGFDEISGNFQENNYGNGGLGSDYVHADAQDGSGTDNANFATPPDGSNPRMQMYIWTNPFSQFVTVNSPITVTGSYTANPSVNGGTGNGLTADLALVNDGVAPTDDGCQAILNDLTGKIALMVWSQGICNSSVFVGNAFAAGADAAIIVDITPIPLTNFGGNAAIPSVAIGSDHGQLFLDAIGDGETINATLEDNPDGQINRDSDLDNGIIAHEYGHGISNRLTGGPGNTSCLNNAEQMGEGWSDLMTLILHADAADTGTTNRGVGTYAQFAPPDGVGIRLFPYTTDMNVNPETYNSIITNGTSPHSLGEVWAAMYWEVYWNLVDKHGYNADIYDDWTTGGNNLALQLLLDGMKLQPCSPGMVDGRNAILAADQLLTGGDNQCEIWEGFAKRGLGFSANQGSSSSRTDGTEAFDLPLACIDAIPAIVVEPGSIESTQWPDTQITHTLTISNVGVNDLLWEIVEQAPALMNGGNWFENFDSYATGSQMHGQGGWKGWDNSPAAGALTTDTQAFSLPNSVDILGGSDLVHEYSGYTSGQWTYTAWQYIPTGYTGQTYFILLNTYADGGPYNWSTQICFDSVTGLLYDVLAGTCTSSNTLPIVYDEWVQIRVEIDLDADTQAVYYDEQLLFQDSWTEHASGGGALNIGAVDLYANGASSVYYDNISLHPVGDICSSASDIPWVTVSPITGTVSAGFADEAAVTMDSTGLATGVYTGTLCVESNDPVTPFVEVPLTLTVEEPPVYGVNLTAVDDTLTGTTDAVVTYTVNITNTGDVTDSFAITTTGNSWVTDLSAASITLAAGGSGEILVMVHVPADAANNAMDTVTVTAVSDGDGSVSDSVTLMTTAVAEETNTIYLPVILKP